MVNLLGVNIPIPFVDNFFGDFFNSRGSASNNLSKSKGRGVPFTGSINPSAVFVDGNNPNIPDEGQPPNKELFPNLPDVVPDIPIPKDKIPPDVTIPPNETIIPFEETPELSRIRNGVVSEKQELDRFGVSRTVTPIQRTQRRFQ